MATPVCTKKYTNTQLRPIPHQTIQKGILLFFFCFREKQNLEKKMNLTKYCFFIYVAYGNISKFYQTFGAINVAEILFFDFWSVKRAFVEIYSVFYKNFAMCFLSFILSLLSVLGFEFDWRIICVNQGDPGKMVFFSEKKIIYNFNQP